ncbi:vesicle-trafficking protein SEC22c [Polypterus senegalus]|uniref:vesicle-trafficking protein SEC22c n=1 Tax=Polypterus senegalus TaxID=55291 RepID=UPI0019647BE2|nr:vesicle-trafficking protein SEC22c [Polypterus senegalus]
MSLILFACIFRARDGLPLSASTDFEHSTELQVRKQQLKSLSKSLTLCPERGIVKGTTLNIYFASLEGVAFMVICSSSIPTAMAFCFLEDIKWEFFSSYNNIEIGLASRPYPFLEFDSVIQKIKHHYCHHGKPSLQVSLADVEEDLRRKPAKVLMPEDLLFSNGTINGHILHPLETSQNQKLGPVTALGILSLVLNIMCAALNIIRAVHLIENTFQDDTEALWNVVSFLLAFFSCVCQCYLYLFTISAKNLLTFTALVLVVLCNIFLYGPRNIWQITFHIGVASFSTYLILMRQPQERSSDCNV